MKTIFNVLDKRRPFFIWGLSVLAVVAVCLVTVSIERYLDITPLLIIPVVLASWYGDTKTGVGLSLLASIALYITNSNLFESGAVRSVPIYDALVVLFVYLFIAIIVLNFKKVHDIEVLAADTDDLTGAHSSRSFYAVLTNEIRRSDRYGHVFSLAYIDVDNFKNINDTLGHSTGDKLLIHISECLESSFRETDTISRLGGDEFVCLMPETDQKEAKSAMLKAEKMLIEDMKNNQWDVGFSIGIVTFETLPEDMDEAVKIADKLMYTVKNNKKNGIAYQVWHGSV